MAPAVVTSRVVKGTEMKAQEIESCKAHTAQAK